MEGGGMGEIEGGGGGKEEVKVVADSVAHVAPPSFPWVQGSKQTWPHTPPHTPRPPSSSFNSETG